MKNGYQWLSSSVLLSVGLLIATLSLRGMHVRATYAAGNQFEIRSNTQNQINLNVVSNPNAPGSLPYLAVRGWERARLLWLSEEQTLREYLYRVGARRQSAERLIQQGKDQAGWSTYLRSFGYLHQVAHGCFALEGKVDCSLWAEEISQATDELVESLQDLESVHQSDQFRAQLNGLLVQISILREQFQF